MFHFNSGFVFDIFNESVKVSNGKNVDSQKMLELGKHDYFSTETLLLTRSLSKTTYALNKLYDSKRLENFFHSLKFNNETSIELLMYETVDFGYAEDCH
jgi:hypothetical protein